jgi:uncharacterized membrane protein YcgQ (UPF0703/DUF1980 family)
MGKIAIIVLAASLFITGCTRTETEENPVIEIRERMFMTQIQDIHLNVDDFLGRTIKLEGIFIGMTWDGANYNYVVRGFSDGCCGGGNVGFEVMWPQGRPELYPENNSWVEAEGVLKLFQGDSFRNLYLELVSLNVLETRGAEVVWR